MLVIFSVSCRQSHPLRVSFLAQFSFAYFFFIELWQSSVCWWQRGCQFGGEVQGRFEVARYSPEIVNFCLLLLDFYLLGGDGNGEWVCEVAIQDAAAAAFEWISCYSTQAPPPHCTRQTHMKYHWVIVYSLDGNHKKFAANGGSQSERCSRKFKFKQWMELVVNIKDGSCRE